MAFRSLLAVSLTLSVSGISSLDGKQNASQDACKAQVQRAAESQRAKSESLASVDIDPATVSLKELRALLGEVGRVGSSSVRNIRTVYWLLGPIGGVQYATEHCKDWGPTPSESLFSAALKADFLSSSDAIDETAHPISIQIDAPFAGALRGLRVTDPESKIVEAGTRAGFKSSDGPPKSIKLDSTWEVRWNLDKDPQHSQYIEVRDVRYILTVR